MGILIIGPQGHVVHVTNITAQFQVFLFKAIEPAEVEVGEMLRCQATALTTLRRVADVKIPVVNQSGAGKGDCLVFDRSIRG